MKPDEIRNLAEEEIRAEIEEVKEELMKLRFQQATGELTDYTRITQLRRNIARLNTILNERNREVKVGGKNE